MLQRFAARQAAPAPPLAAAGRGLRARRPLPPAVSTERGSVRRSVRPPASARGARCTASAAAADLPAPVALRVVFSLRCRVEFGATLKVVGSHDALGAWDVAQALPMAWNEGDVWTVSAELPEHFVVRYKFIVIRADGTLQWQPGEDSTTIASRAAARLGADAAVPLDVFRLNAKLPYGEEFVLVGDDAAIGAWDPSRGVVLRWTCTDVWQASVALPRDRAVEYKLVRRNTATGETAWVEGYNARVAPLSESHLRFLVDNSAAPAPDSDAEAEAASLPAAPLPASSALRALPVTRHVHRQLGGWWQPWYWAPELGDADGLVYLADAGAVPLSFDEGVSAAVDMAALLDVREAAPNGFAGMQAAGESAGAEGGAKALRAAAAKGARGAGASVTPALPPRVAEVASQLSEAAAEWSRANPQAAAAARSAAAAGVASAAVAASGSEAALAAMAQPAAEAAALGMIVAFGARNLLFADDRKRFLAAAADRDKLLQLIRDNMAAVGVGDDSDVAVMISKSAADAGLAEFDPLELLSDDAPRPEVAKLKNGAKAAAKAAEVKEPVSAE